MPKRTSLKRLKGFTLVELAIAIVIISTILTLGIAAAITRMESNAISNTKKRQEIIRDALIAFLGKNKRLPCPDNNPFNPLLPNNPPTPPDGVEKPTLNGGVPDPTLGCQSSFGVVPYQTLGLAREIALDGYDNYFSYQVSTIPYNWTLSANFNAGMSGGLTIKPSTTLPALPTPAAAVLVSHGKNGNGAFNTKGYQNQAPPPDSPDEIENVNRDTTYVSKDVLNDSFDDMLLVLYPQDLVGPAVSQKSIKSYYEEVSDTKAAIEDIKSALIGFTVANGRLPYANDDGTGSCATLNTNLGVEGTGCFIGNIPWATLGVKRNDAWNNLIKYALSPSLAPITATGSVALPVSSGNYDFVVTGSVAFPANALIRLQDANGRYVQGTVNSQVATTVNVAVTTSSPASVPAVSWTTTSTLTIPSSFKYMQGSIVVSDGTAVLTPYAPFVVYSLGRNRGTFLGQPCTTLAPNNINPPVPPACLGTNEWNNFNSTTVSAGPGTGTGIDVGTAAFPYIKASSVLPLFTGTTTPDMGYDDIVDYVSKSQIDAKMP
jgi:prepilin-type N-terminal cleavage/methylation domain-containing protein